jgi:predicted amidohydrolase
MPNLNLTLLQADLAWENPKANRARLEELAAQAHQPDVLLLPETFTSGFTMNAQAVAEPDNGPTAKWMQTLAQRHNCLVAGSHVVSEEGRFYNRLRAVTPDGQTFSYDKRHLFRMAGEHKVYAPGMRRIVARFRGWRIAFFICYDLRFPAWSRNVWDEGAADYDIALFVANWPERRRTHWQKLLMARAIENQAYVVGLNRVGADGNNISYVGDSAIIDYAGEPMLQLGKREAVGNLCLSLEPLRAYREAFPAWMDADPFTLA